MPIGRLLPALRRLKVIRFDGRFSMLSSQQIGELSGTVGDCDTLKEFGYNLDWLSSLGKCSDEFKAICQLWSRNSKSQTGDTSSYVDPAC